MLTIHYDVGRLPVTVTTSVDAIQATLTDLYPSVPAHTENAARFRITSDQVSYSLLGPGVSYHTTERDTLVPALESQIRDLYVAQADRAWVLHSSGFLTDQGEAVLVIGQPGAGKTTLALRAIAGGACGLSDELHLWYPQQGVVVGYPRAYAIKEGTFRAFPEFLNLIGGLAPSQWNNRPLWYVNPHRLGLSDSAKPVTLRALVFLSRQGDQQALRPLPHWRRLSTLLSHAWVSDRVPFGDRFGDILSALEAIDVWEGGPDAVLETYLGYSMAESSHAIQARSLSAREGGSL